MSATRTQKSEVVVDLKDRLTRSPAIYVTDFTGLTVKRMTDLRRKLRGVGVGYVVVKNTLAARAFAEVKISGMDDVLAGATGLVFAGSDPVGAAKVLADFHKEFQQPTVKAGLLEGRRITADEVKRLATLPSRAVLLAQLGGAFQAPMAGFVGALNGLLYQWVGALEALRVQRGNAA
ncbi:MAG: 50S ribosomal protein L10 [Gemmatimonadetes bacterium]|nr:50S ribosomal protein L10 [Gemmatimonadota bacterium]